MFTIYVSNQERKGRAAFKQGTPFMSWTGAWTRSGKPLWCLLASIGALHIALYHSWVSQQLPQFAIIAYKQLRASQANKKRKAFKQTFKQTNKQTIAAIFKCWSVIVIIIIITIKLIITITSWRAWTLTRMWRTWLPANSRTCSIGIHL